MKRFVLIPLFAVLSVVGCGDEEDNTRVEDEPGVSVNVSNIITQNQDSQNGNVSCEFEREPVFFGDQVLCQVELVCEGAPVSQPQFENLPSDQCISTPVSQTESEARLAEAFIAAVN